MAEIYLSNPEWQIEQEVANKTLKRKDVALTYALAIMHPDQKSRDWARMNNAILSRWSKSGLIYIKTLAWRKVQERRHSEWSNA